MQPTEQAQILENIAGRSNPPLSELERTQLITIAAQLRNPAQATDAGTYVIDISRPVAFYDDRAKSDGQLQLTQVLFVKGELVLCEARFPGDDEVATVLFNRASCEVLTENYLFWYATNDCD